MLGLYVITLYNMLMRKEFLCYLHYAGFPKTIRYLSSYLELTI